jgi:hypothetical protein
MSRSHGRTQRSMNMTNQIRSLKDEKFREFEPLEDITAYELAIILKLAQLGFVTHYIEELPEKLRRHFK